MFWIGLIVGVVITLLAIAGYFLWCMKNAQMSFREYGDFCEFLGDALDNRESTMQVWHDGELLNEMNFEEK